MPHTPLPHFQPKKDTSGEAVQAPDREKRCRFHRDVLQAVRALVHVQSVLPQQRHRVRQDGQGQNQ